MINFIDTLKLSFIENKKPSMKRSIERNINSMEDCEQLCNDEQECIYWWYLNRGKKCAMYTMELRDKKNTGAGKKHCHSDCNVTIKPITCDDGWTADDDSGRNLG